MKNLIKRLLDKTPYTIIRTSVFEKMVHLNNLHHIDCYFFLKKFIERENNKILFDVGANTGETAKKMYQNFPDSSIYSFEPVKETYEILERTTSHISNIKVFNAGLGSKTEKKEIYLYEYSELNSFISQNDEDKKKHLKIKEESSIISLDEFVLNNKIENITILKSDTEGFELEVINGAAASFKSHIVDFIYIEVGFNEKDSRHIYFLNIINHLKVFDYVFIGFFEVVYEKMQLHYANALFASCSALAKYQNG